MALVALLAQLFAFAPGREVSAPVNGPSPGTTTVMEVLSRPDGGFFVTWYDGRSFISDPEAFVPWRASRVVGSTLVDLTGVALPLDVPGLVSLRTVHQGNALELVFSERPGGLSDNVLHAVRVTEAGVVVRPDVVLGTTPHVVSQLVASFDGTRTLVAWVENDERNFTGSRVRLASLTPAGVVTTTTVTSAGPYAHQALSLAASGTGETLLVWTENLDPPRAVRIPRGGVAGSPFTLPVGDGRVVTHGLPDGGWLLSWDEFDAGVISLKLSALGVDGGASASALIDATTSQYAVAARLAIDGASARVVWTNYLDVKARTVPVRGPPSLPTQVLRTGLPFEPGAALACSAGECLVSWEESVPQGAFGGNALLSRLTADSRLADVPPFEIVLPADEQRSPTLASDGVGHYVVFTRAIGRQPREMVVRRLTADGGWVDPAPLSLGVRHEPLAVAPLVDGGVLVAATYSPPLGVDNAVYGFRVGPTGAPVDGGVWFNASFQPSRAALACTASRCGLLGEGFNGVLGSVISPAGVRLSQSNVYLSFLGTDSRPNLVAVGTRFVVLYANTSGAQAAIADESAFPTFGAPIALAPGVTSGPTPVGIATSATSLAVFVHERNTCRVLLRQLDVATGQLTAATQPVYQCAAQAGGVGVQAVVRNGAGYSALVQEVTTLPSGAFQSDTVLLELDAAFQVTSQALLDRRTSTPRVSFTRVGARPVVAHAEYDPSPGVHSTRVWLSGLDAFDAGAFDAGVDAGVLDAGVDAGVADAGLDAGAPDAGVDAGVADAGADAGAPDAGFDAGVPDAGGVAVGEDAGVTEPPPPGVPSGCGCTSAPVPVLVLIALLGMRRQRGTRRG